MSIDNIVKPLKISEILPVCNLDYVYDTCSPLEVLKKLIKQPKLCHYRTYDKDTGKFYCRWVIEEQVYYPKENIRKWD